MAGTEPAAPGGGLFDLVAAAYVFATPLVLAALAWMARRHDPVAAWALAGLAALFCLQMLAGLVGAGRGGGGAGGGAHLRAVGLSLATAAGLAWRLGRDRRRGHLRSRGESLAVLALGALLLAALLAAPALRRFL